MSKYRKDIVRLRKEGKSYRDIKVILDCSKSIVAYWCEKENLTDIGMKNYPISEKKKRKINEIYQEKTAQETGKILGISEWSVVKYAEIDKPRHPLPDNILDVSSRTTSKIVNRLREYEGLECSVCGWNAGRGDIHHIEGKNFDGCNNHNNLSYLCPNCHRLLHTTDKINKADLTTLKEQIGDVWKDYYYSVGKNNIGSVAESG